jgi:hypothetical protein
MDQQQAENETTIDSILARVELPAQRADELTAMQRSAGERAARKAWHTARAADQGFESSRAAAQDAYTRAVLALAPQPRTRPEVEPIDSSEPAPLARLDVLGPTSPLAASVSPPANGGARAPTRGDQDRARRAGVSADGAARSLRDKGALEAVGFAPRTPLYERGTRVIDLGVENARASRAEHDAKPTVEDACTALIQRIAGEERGKCVVEARGIGMTDAGLLHLGAGPALPITLGALGGLTSRLGYSGATYLGEKCPPVLRAMNVNFQRRIIEDREALAAEAATQAAAELGKRSTWAPQELALRTRRNAAGGKEVFAAVSPTYTPFDCDKVAEALRRAAATDHRAKGARATVAYDGERARFEVMFHSDIQPLDYVAGEFFKAGVLISTSDIGGGAVLVRSAAWQNLCLNLIVIDRCLKPIASIRHVGSVLELTKRFERAFKAALESIGHFLQVWGYACHEDAAARIRQATGEALPAAPLELVEGIFRGIVDSGLVTVKGRTEAIVEGLVRCWEADESAARQQYNGVTRAAIVNAFTRYAHAELEAGDPWGEDEISIGAGGLLWGRQGRDPAPLPFLTAEDAAAPRAQQTVSSAS